MHAASVAARMKQERRSWEDGKKQLCGLLGGHLTIRLTINTISPAISCTAHVRGPRPGTSGRPSLCPSPCPSLCPSWPASSKFFLKELWPLDHAQGDQKHGIAQQLLKIPCLSHPCREVGMRKQRGQTWLPIARSGSRLTEVSLLFGGTIPRQERELTMGGTRVKGRLPRAKPDVRNGTL